jgi:hypothetical protein
LEAESFWCCTKLALLTVRRNSDGSKEIKELDRGNGGGSHMGLSYGVPYPEETASSGIAWGVLGGTSHPPARLNIVLLHPQQSRKFRQTKRAVGSRRANVLLGDASGLQGRVFWLLFTKSQWRIPRSDASLHEHQPPSTADPEPFEDFTAATQPQHLALVRRPFVAD